MHAHILSIYNLMAAASKDNESLYYYNDVTTMNYHDDVEAPGVSIVNKERRWTMLFARFIGHVIANGSYI